MSKKKKSAKKTAKKGSSSLLTRLFGKKGADKGKAAAKKAKVKPLTPLQRSIAEMQQMTKIGKRDPERLAQLLITMLGKERAKEEADKRSFDEQVWDIVHRDEEKNAEPADGDDDNSIAPPPS
ncbi:MAG: hypothetical protein ACI906_000870 [Candidatus Latescibacterota bacterium]|jgi:hypothetical protein